MSLVLRLLLHAAWAAFVTWAGVCRVGLQFEVDEAGMQAKFRKKLRSLVVTVPVIRDLRPQLKPVQPDGSPAMAVSLKDGDYYGSNGSEQEEGHPPPYSPPTPMGPCQ